MGTPSLNKLVCDKCSIRVKTLNNVANNLVIVAVDMSIYLHIFIKKSTSISEFVLNVLAFMTKLKEHRLEPIIVLDGKSRKEKEGTLRKRRNQRNNVQKRIHTIQNQLANIRTKIEDTKDTTTTVPDLRILETTLNSQLNKLVKKCSTISNDHVNILKEILTMLGIVYLHSVEEADPLCAALVKNGIAQCCLSNDTDMLVHGCPVTYQNFMFHTNNVTEFRLDDILKELKINYDQFVDMSILMGTDYNKPLSGIKPEIALEAIQQYQTIENILQNLDIINNTIVKRYRDKNSSVKYLRKPEKGKFNYQNIRNLIKTEVKIADYIQNTNYQQLTPEWLHGSHRLITLEKYLIDNISLDPTKAQHKVRYINLVWASVIKTKNYNIGSMCHPLANYNDHLVSS